MKKALLCSLLAAVMICAAVGTVAARALEGDPLPEFTIKMMDGTELVSTQLAAQHKTMIITFIQTACSACRGEIIELSRLNEKNKDIFVLPIAVDMRTGVEFLESYKKENNVPFNFGMDPKFKVPRMFGASFTPATIVIEDSTVTKIFRGYDDEIKEQLTQFF